MAIENALKPGFCKLEKWTEEKKKAGEMKKKLIEKELDLIEAELCLEEAIEDMDEELRMKEKEEEKKMEMGLQEEEDTFVVANQEGKATKEEEDEEEKEDDVTPSSFRCVAADRDPIKKDQKGKKPRESPFSSSTLSFASCSLISAVPSTLRQSILSLKQGRLPLKSYPPSSVENSNDLLKTIDSVSFPPVLGHKGRLRTFKRDHQKFQPQNHSGGQNSQLHALCKILSCPSATANTRSSLRRPRKHNHFELHASDSILSFAYSSLLFGTIHRY